METNTNELKLLIDNREKEIKKSINGDNIIYKNLDIGDIVYEMDNNILLVIERKTLSDLSSSIIDGRYKEQKARLLNTGIDRNRILYLIEGNLSINTDEKIGSLTTDTLWGSIINMMLRDGINVYKSNNINETIFLIQKLYNKIKKDGDLYWKYDEKKQMTDVDYSSTLKTKKKLNLTSNVWFIHLLSSIPRVSETIANEIVKEYITLQNLINEYEKLNINDRPLMLSNIKLQLKNNKTKKLGDKISKSIYEFIYGIN
jgi:crossover junction endonuclease MUS81